MSKTPCSVLNSKIRGKKVYLPDDDESLISTALSLVWTKTDKKVDLCIFEQDRVRMSYKKNEGRIYFDLEESLSNFTFIDKVYDNFCPLPFILFLSIFRFWTTLSTFFRLWTTLSTFFFDFVLFFRLFTTFSFFFLFFSISVLFFLFFFLMYHFYLFFSIKYNQIYLYTKSGQFCPLIR